ncbi:MAG TPA: Dabb family protein [Lichenihabitans sp.]|jgi:hypothetical protein|nr:Dabb family protein [Lichenihabitans sp.]
MIRHIVLVKFRADVGRDAVAGILRRVGGLRDVLPGMIGFAGGRQVSPESLGRGFTHAFTCDFADEAARDAYLVHPSHEAVGAEIVAAADGGLDGLTVVDFKLE